MSGRSEGLALVGLGMVKRIASLAVVALVLLAACGAVCQELRQSLPDAPSAVAAASQAQRFNGFAEGARSPLNFGGKDVSPVVIRQDGFVLSDRAAFRQKDPDAIFRKYLYPSSLGQQAGYHSAGGSLTGRAAIAASRTLIVRDDSGKGKLNTSYLLRTLTAVAKDTASTPYWRRSVGTPFNDFGSTVSNDARTNLWHEFGPGLGHVMKSHAPGFVSRIEERIGRASVVR